MATAAIVASCRPWRHGTASFRFRPRTTSSPAFRVSCTAGPTTSDATSTSGAGGGGSNDKKHVDTRIHWENETDGWIGGDLGEVDGGGTAQTSASGRRGRSGNAGILDQAADSHYRYLGISADAEAEEIKSAYRRLSKLYHPDSTQLPLEIAAQKFMRLKDVYDTLSNQELRNLYDSRLANKIVSNPDGGMYGYPISSQQGYDLRTQKRPERVDVDTLGGSNMPLSGQALSALAFDLFVLLFCIIVVLFVAFIKNRASIQ